MNDDNDLARSDPARRRNLERFLRHMDRDAAHLPGPVAMMARSLGAATTSFGQAPASHSTPRSGAEGAGEGLFLLSRA